MGVLLPGCQKESGLHNAFFSISTVHGVSAVNLCSQNGTTHMQEGGVSRLQVISGFAEEQHVFRTPHPKHANGD